MRKQFISLALTAVMTVALSACGSKDPAYLSGITAEDYVDVADYSSIPVEEAAPSVSDDYLDMYIQYQLSMNATNEEVTDRDTVQDGDIVNIDYTGTKDGKEFDGGSAAGYDLTIGSGSFIDGFEDGLIGHKVGETVKLNLKFPDDYSNTELAGAAVVFTVKINKIEQRVTPELTDEFAASQNITGVSTVEDYRNYCRETLMKQAQSSYDSDVQSQIIKYMVDNSTFKQDPPTEMVERMNTSFTDTFTAYAGQYGMKLSDFMAAQGSDSDNYEQDIRDMATDTAKEYLIMQVIADREDLNVSKRDLNTALSTEAAQNGYSSVSDFKKDQDLEAYREYLMVQNVLKFLQKKADVTEPSDSASTESAAGTDSTEASTEDSAAVASTESASQ